MGENESCCSGGNLAETKQAYEGTMETKLKDLGAKIDEFSEKAGEKWEQLHSKRKDAHEKFNQVKAKSGEAYVEFKSGMDKAFEELHQAFEEAKLGTEKATAKLKK